ncbi:hypothetical protein LLG95_02375 [bacterium]|nr:hypothetical protein [bacterium]
MPLTRTTDAAPGRRPLSAPRYAVGYIIFVTLLLGGALWGMSAYRAWIDRYQRERPRYAAERAIEALDAGQTDEARLQIDLLADERPIYAGDFLHPNVSEVYEGAVFRDRVTIYERLCARLIKAGMFEQARTVANKTLFEYHIASRPLEMIEPWELVSLAAAVNNDWYASFEAARILAAHGADRVRTPAQMQPIPQPENPTQFKDFARNVPPVAIRAMKVFYDNPTGNEWDGVTGMLDTARGATASPAVANQIDSMLHRAYLRAGKPDRARQLLARKWGRDPGFMETYWKTWPHAPASFLTDREPSLMEFLWAERAPGAKPTLANFMDSFQPDPRVQVYDFSAPDAFKPLDTGYFNEKNEFYVIGDSVGMFNNVAGWMEVETRAPSYQIAIGYKGSNAIGIMPILLVQVDNGPYIPVYCDSSEPAIATADINMAPGIHRLSFVYVNDGIFEWPPRKIEEDRNLTLYRFALIQVKRPG